ncbi:MAG: PilT/PilU family type 4a pilus ATPase, partial [Candidatus Riflebacteria bacterium]|nr:PilT/PilU family type 4a pilus ATPase [Candidatus Riflebacteria bacterium]
VVTFNVRGRLPAGRHQLAVVATSNGASFTTGYTPVAYDHIRPQRLYRPATLGIEAVDVKLPRALSIAYITGVGDNVAPMLEQLMGTLLDRNGSDIHLKQGRRPVLRLDGELTNQDIPPLSGEMMWSLVQLIASPHECDQFEEQMQLDTAYAYKDRARFRTNIYLDQLGISIALRLIPSRIPTWQDVGLPKQGRDLVFKGHGLFLVTGPTGSGKTTTIAALIREINEREYKHVVTIEDPIEFMYKDDKCTITQREVPVDTPSFAAGVLDALRQDPDIILVGEMRNLETMATTLLAAEAGKLVMATVHTTSAYQTVERILNAFPAEQQGQVRFQLAATLVGIVSQVLVPKRGGGRSAAFELMVANEAIRASIRDAKPYLIQNAIETGAALGMRSLDQALVELLDNGAISYESAFEKCQNPANFQKLEAKYKGAGQ